MALQASVGLQGFEVVLFRAVAFCSVLFDMVGPVLGPRGNENLIYLDYSLFRATEFRCSGSYYTYRVALSRVSGFGDYSFFRAAGFRCSGLYSLL